MALALAIKAGNHSKELEKLLRAVRGVVSKTDMAELWHIQCLLYKYKAERVSKN